MAKTNDQYCSRVLTKEQMIEELKKGHTLCIDRIDAPELPELLQMEQEGLITSKLVEVDEQSSFRKFWWIAEKVEKAEK